MPTNRSWFPVGNKKIPNRSSFYMFVLVIVRILPFYKHGDEYLNIQELYIIDIIIKNTILQFEG